MFTKGQGRGALTPTTPSDGPESTAIEVEDIPVLLRDVVRFAEAVEKLKDVVLAEGKKKSKKKSPLEFLALKVTFLSISPQSVCVLRCSSSSRRVSGHVV